MATRRTFTRRRYRGEEHAYPLLECFNHSERERPDKGKVLWFLKQLQSLIVTASWEDMSKRFDFPQSHLVVRPIMQGREWKATWNDLKKKLRKCKFHPDLGGIADGERLSFYWRSLQENTANRLIHEMLLLANLGMLLRVKQCRQCQTWFYAKFSHARFCAPVCRKKYSDSVLRGKERRREYMEDYMRDYRRKKKREKKR